MKVSGCWLNSGIIANLLFFLIRNSLCDVKENSTSVFAGDSTLKPIPGAEVFAREIKDAEKYQFSAEFSRLLSMFAKNVYTDRKAVVRELISNAIDAIEKQHSERLGKAASEGAELDNVDNYRVTVEIDKENRVLSFTDNGIGMTHDELKLFLGTIAKSGTAEYAAKEGTGKSSDVSKDSQMIGQFGVGFYSVLLVADKVAVISKSDKDPKQWIWETDTSASFRITEDNGSKMERGTRILLKLKEDADDFLNHESVEKIMKEFFGYDRHRIYIVKPKTITEEVPIEEEEKKEEEQTKAEEDKAKKSNEDDVVVEDEDKEKEKPKTKKVEKTVLEEVLISQNVKPIWLRSPSEVKSEEYESLYKSISGDKYGKPIAYTHFVGETARSEGFKAILFIPERPPFQAFSPKEQKLDIKLHVKGVFVTAKFENFIPKHLSFVKGVIDSDDLSLNISREILQNTAELRGIKKKVVKKIIEMMSDLQSDAEKYKKFYDSYSSFIKLEIGENEDYRALLSKLLRYKSTKSKGEEMRSLEQYVEGLSDSQKEKKNIYYVAGQMDEIEKSPFLARFQEKDIEVLLMTEPVDEHCIQRLEKYEEFKFVNIAKDGLKLDEEEEKSIKEFDEKYEGAKKWIAKSLSETVEKVVFVPGPANIPGSFKSTENGWSGNMERLVMAQASVKEDPMLAFFAKQRKVLELNPKNPLIGEILERANNGEKRNAELKVLLRTLTDSMLIWSGYSVRDAQVFASGIERLTRKALDLPVEALPEEKEEENKNNEKDSEEDEIEIDADEAVKASSEEKEEKEEL